MGGGGGGVASLGIGVGIGMLVLGGLLVFDLAFWIWGPFWLICVCFWGCLEVVGGKGRRLAVDVKLSR